MSLQKILTTPRNNIWNLNSRYRVGDTVLFNGDEFSNVTGRNSEPGTDANWKQIGGSGGNGLVPVDDGSGNISWHLKEAGTENRIPRGRGALDFSYKNADGSAAGEGDVHFGDENASNADFGNNFVQGSANLVEDCFFNAIVFGFLNRVIGGYQPIVFGFLNDVDTNKSVAGSIALGQSNKVREYCAKAFGDGLIAKTKGTVVVGEGNTDYPTTGAQDPNRPMFVVGIGYMSVNQGSYGTVTERKDGLVVRKTGSVEAPELSTALIDSGIGKTLVTKEWIESNVGSRIRKVVEFDTVGFPLSSSIGLEILSENDITSDQYYKIHSIDFRVAPDDTTPGPSGFNNITKVSYRWGTSTLQKILPAAEIEADSDEAPNDVGSISIRRALFKSTRIIRGQGIYLGSDAALPITGSGRAITTIDYEIIDLESAPAPTLGLRILENNPAGLSQGAPFETITVRATIFGGTGNSSFAATDSNNLIVIPLPLGDTSVEVNLILDAQGNFLLNYNLTGLEATAFVSIEIIARSETLLPLPVFPNNIIELSNQ